MSTSSSPTRRPHRASPTPVIAGSLVGFIVLAAIVATLILVNQRQKRLRNQRLFDLTYVDDSLKTTPKNTPLGDKDPSNTCDPLQKDEISSSPTIPPPSKPRNSQRTLQHMSPQHNQHPPPSLGRSHARSYVAQTLTLPSTSDKPLTQPHIPIVLHQGTLLRQIPHGHAEYPDVFSADRTPEGSGNSAGTPGMNKAGPTGSSVLQENKNERSGPNGPIASGST